MHHDIGDVAVDEDLARQHADDLVGRHPAVGAADPEVFGILLPGELGKKIRIGLLDLSAQCRFLSKKGF